MTSETNTLIIWVVRMQMMGEGEAAVSMTRGLFIKLRGTSNGLKRTVVVGISSKRSVLSPTQTETTSSSPSSPFPVTQFVLFSHQHLCASFFFFCCLHISFSLTLQYSSRGRYTSCRGLLSFYMNIICTEPHQSNHNTISFSHFKFSLALHELLAGCKQLAETEIAERFFKH